MPPVAEEEDQGEEPVIVAEEEEEKLTIKLNEKQHLIKLLNDKVRSYENELTSRNL